jgi:protein phosphatase 1 regulatory subunit 11
MATSRPTVTETETDQLKRTNPPPTLVLGLNHTIESGSRVRWTEETIDNEHLNKKKSKCCCIYAKPHDPQSNKDDQITENNEFDNCQHCRYHTESDYSTKTEERQPKIKLVVEKSQLS